MVACQAPNALEHCCRVTATSASGFESAFRILRSPFILAHPTTVPKRDKRGLVRWLCALYQAIANPKIPLGQNESVCHVNCFLV